MRLASADPRRRHGYRVLMSQDRIYEKPSGAHKKKNTRRKILRGFRSRLHLESARCMMNASNIYPRPVQIPHFKTSVVNFTLKTISSLLQLHFCLQNYAKFKFSTDIFVVPNVI